MSEVFDEYERAYCDASTAASRKVEAAKAAAGPERRSALTEAEASITEAEALVRRMDLEARSVAPASKAALLTKLKDYKADLAALKKECRGAASAATAGEDARAELGLGDEFASTAAGQRQRLLDQTARVNASGDRIRQSRQTLAETEELGSEILGNLHRQRETIVHARDTLYEADDNIGTSRKVLVAMARRALTNKVIMGGVILVLIAAICLIVYYKFIRSDNNR